MQRKEKTANTFISGDESAASMDTEPVPAPMS